MTQKDKTKKEILAELEEVKNRLAEAEETLSAIQRGEVDAIVGSSGDGGLVYTLQGAEHPYRVFFEAMNEGAVTMTRDGTILYCNRRFADLAGAALETVTGMSFLDFIAEDSRTAIAAFISETCSDKCTVEGSLKTKGAGVVPVTISINSLNTKDMEAVCAVVTDLSELVLMRKVEEANQRLVSINEALQASEKTMRDSRLAALNLMEDAVAARKQTDDANARLLQEVSERKRAEAALRESEGRVRLKLESILSPDGDIRDLELADIIDALAIQSLVTDLYAFVQLPIGILDLKGNVLVGVGWQDICTKFHRTNPDTCRHCTESDLELTRGVSPGEFRLYKCKNGMWDAVTPILVGGQHMGNLFWGQFFFDDEQPDRDFFRTQARNYGFNEDEYLAALEKVPRISRAALEQGMVFYRKLAEMLSKLSYGNVKLARSLAQREELTADVLKLSEDMAARNLELETVNKELESFVYSVSHDLRAPLRSVSGFSRILVEDYSDRLDEQARDYLDRIYSGSEKMSQRIEALMHLTKISRQDLDRVEVNLSRVAASLVVDIRHADPARNVEVVIAEDAVAAADLNLVKAVLSNLLENAWKFTAKTENGRVEFGAVDSPLRISDFGLGNETLAEQVKQGKTVYFVRDNGAGFDPAYADRMFWPFHRLHTDSEFEGTGIGLAIVERIVRRHGGRVWAEGEVGKGATVYFTLG